MNNCQAILKKGNSKSGRIYWCIDFVVDNKVINRLFIKETEILYYKELLKIK